MESIFSVVPELPDWIPSNSLCNCKGVCKEWNEQLSSDFVTRRMLLHACPLLQLDKHDKVPTKLVNELKSGILQEVVTFNDQGWVYPHRNVTNGWNDFDDGNTNLSVNEVITQFHNHGYKVSKALPNRHLIWFKRVPALYILLKCREESLSLGLSKVVFNRLSQSVIDSRVTHGWSGFNNGRALRSEFRVERIFLNKGYTISKKTRYYILFSPPNIQG